MIKKELEALVIKMHKKLKLRQKKVVKHKKRSEYNKKQWDDLWTRYYELKKERDQLERDLGSIKDGLEWKNQRIDDLKSDLTNSENRVIDLERALISQSIKYSKEK